MGLFGSLKKRATHRKAAKTLESRRSAKGLTIGYAKNKRGRAHKVVKWFS